MITTKPTNETFSEMDSEMLLNIISGGNMDRETATAIATVIESRYPSPKKEKASTENRSNSLRFICAFRVIRSSKFVNN